LVAGLIAYDQSEDYLYHSAGTQMNYQAATVLSTIAIGIGGERATGSVQATLIELLEHAACGVAVVAVLLPLPHVCT
jgi:hypothetical protein